MKLTPHDYQRTSAGFLLENETGALFLDPGYGKTAIILIAFNALRRLGLVDKILIIAPLRPVYSVWPQEIAKWDCFHELRVSIIHSASSHKAADRRRQAMRADADVYLINPEGLTWLYREMLENPTWFRPTMLAVDESTKFKSPSATRWKALKAMLPIFRRVVIATGTPCPNTLQDLWTQIFMLDGGERLGKFVTHFRSNFFHKIRNNQYITYLPIDGAKEKIEAAIADKVLRLDAKDVLDLPELLINDVFVDLPPKTLKAYKRLERSLFLTLQRDGEADLEVEAMSASAKYLLCRQVANGGCYKNETIDGEVLRQKETIHAAKLDAVEDLRDELNGKPLMVVYQFKHDLARLKERFGNVPHIGGGVTPKTVDRLIKQWNAGELPLLFVQPQAMSHGLNMQTGGDDQAWFGLTDDLEIYLQTIARLYRQGATGERVRIHRILARGTVDELVRMRIDKKDANQQSILDALKCYGADQ